MNAHQAGVTQKEFIILDRKRILLLKENYHEAQPQISPDGRWMAYTSNESGQNQVYVRPFPEVEGGRWQVSTSGGDSPLWSPDGKRFLMMKETGTTTSSDGGPRKINIVLNWFEELKQRVPVK